MATQDRLTHPVQRSTLAAKPANRVDRPLLSVEDLTISYGDDTVVEGVDFILGRGETLALIGESGSGKSTIAHAILRLLGPAATIERGRISYAGQECTTLPERRFRPLRGRRLGFVPQDPASALNPVRTIGSQAQEAARLTDLKTDSERRGLILKTFADVKLPDPELVYRSYPHQLSGGMLQRVLVGLAVLPKPDLIIADEPTSGLDVTFQKSILDLFDELQDQFDLGLMLITHDLAIAAERAHSLIVLQQGKVQERGVAAKVFAAPTSAYTRALQADVPSVNPTRFRSSGSREQASGAIADRPQIEVRGVSKSFVVDGRRVVAVNGVSFAVQRGRTHALVGESGSGKSTTVRLLLGLEQPDAGEIVIAGEVVHEHSPKQWRNHRRHLALVYQNPYTSLDPTWRLDRIVREPLDRFNIGDRSQRSKAVDDALDAVKLPKSLRSRRPTHLSGGQRQRVAIARALVSRPDVVVLDEPTSALDVSVQATIIELLFELQRELGLTYLFVSHDLSLVRQIADTASVLKHGLVVESGNVEQLFARPTHPYTQSLLDAVPGITEFRRAV